MLQPAGTALVEQLEDRVGSALRAVAHHEDDDWTIACLRDDLRAEHADAEKDDIAEDLVLTGLAAKRQEHLYGLGSLEATVRLFEDGFVLHVPVDDRSGYFVSLEGDADVRGREVVDLVRETANLD